FVFPDRAALPACFHGCQGLPTQLELAVERGHSEHGDHCHPFSRPGMESWPRYETAYQPVRAVRGLRRPGPRIQMVAGRRIRPDLQTDYHPWGKVGIRCRMVENVGTGRQEGATDLPGRCFRECDSW